MERIPTSTSPSGNCTDLERFKGCDAIPGNSVGDSFNYDAWVDTYTDKFKERCEDTQDYSANVFLTAAEQVAWQIAGYLLAWRIVRSPQVGSVEYSLGRKKYVLEQGRESDITLAFLEAQVLQP